MSKLGVSVSGSVPGNPPHKPFLCIFKHNEVFTYPTTAFSHKVGMDSGFPGTQNPGGFPVPGPHEPRTQNPIRVPVPEKSRLHVFSLFVIQYTLKKIGFLQNPQKRFRICVKASKCVQSLKKRIKKSTKPLKGSSPGHTFETFKYETFFKFRRVEKGFVGKMQNL
jgi:hypothetical protein